jgi:hypothetical protein
MRRVHWQPAGGADTCSSSVLQLNAHDPSLLDPNKQRNCGGTVLPRALLVSHRSMATKVFMRLKRHILGWVSRTPWTMQPWGAASQPDVVVSSTSQYTLQAKRMRVYDKLLFRAC